MSSNPFRPSGSIEFEQVEIKVANPAVPAPAPVDDALDNDLLSINFGRKKDHKPVATERILAGAAIDWLIGFPAEARPKALCERFPHVANRLAKNWPGPTATLRALAADARWGSAGYPVQVQNELQRLLKEHAALQAAA